MIKSISVVGLGYIGLPTAAMFASHEVKVNGLDVNQNIIDTINRGEVHIVEPDLEMMVKSAVKNGFLKASSTAVNSDAYLIAVPTPFKNQDSQIPEPDISFIKKAINLIAPVLKKGEIIILESTSPVGTTEKISEWLSDLRQDLSFPHISESMPDINIAYCPERVLPGSIIKELVSNDRIIGGLTDSCSKKAIDLYKIFVEGSCKVTNARTAEMVKLTENSSRDVQIAFANELSIICDLIDINVWELIALSNLHPRVNILQPGPGVGGHCLAVDPWFIVSKTPNQAKLIHTARNINDSKASWVVKKIENCVKRFLLDHPGFEENEIVISCYGLAFKPDIDDLRESPAMSITLDIAQCHSGRVLAVEPNIGLDQFNFENIELVDSLYARDNAHIHVLLVDHKEFKSNKLQSNYLIDTKGIWSQ